MVFGVVAGMKNGELVMAGVAGDCCTNEWLYLLKLKVATNVISDGCWTA